MADYYSLLSRAVSNLPKSSPPSARRAIYDRARKALIGQLRSLKPALPESDIAREENALDAAVNRLEAEFGPSSAVPPSAPSPPVSHLPPARPIAPPRAPLAPRPQAPLKPPTLALKTTPAPPQTAASSAPALGSAAGGSTAAPSATAGPARPAPPVASPPRQSPPGGSAARPPPSGASAQRPLPPAASAAALVASFTARGGDAKTAEASAVAPPVSADAAEGAGPDNAPRIGSPLEAAAPRAEADAARPSAPGRYAPRLDNPWPWIALAVVIGLAAAVAVLAFLFRQRPQDLAIKEPVEVAPIASPAANGQKIAERVGGAPAAPPSETPSPTPTQTPLASGAAGAGPTQGSPTAAPSPSPSIAAQTEAAALPVTARAAMLVATAADAQKPAVTIGTVVWSAVPALPGQPGSVGVKAEVDIVDLKMHATMTLRKNTDAALPASHTIDLRMTFEDGSSIKGVKDIDLPRMRRDDSPEADPLLGVKVKINDTYFLIGLNRADPDIARNMDEIATRGWFDFPLLLNDDRIAKLTFEKGADGDRIVSQAIAAWK